MILRSKQGKIPLMLIAGILVTLSAVIVWEVESKKDLNVTDPSVHDPAINIASRNYVTGDGPQDVIFDGERLWVAETKLGTVSSYGRDGQRLETANVGGSPASLVSGAGFIWALDKKDGSVTQLDSAANIMRKFQVGIEPFGIEFLLDHLWVTDPLRRSVSQISVQGGLINQLELEGSPRVMTKTPEQILVVDGDSHKVIGIDHGGDIVGSFDYPSRIALDGFDHRPGEPAAILSTPEAVWIAFSGIGQVIRLTPSGTYVSITRIPTGPLSLAWVIGELWVVSADAGTITRISSDGTIRITHDIGGSPVAIAHDGENAWVVDDEKNELTVFLPE